MQLSVDEEPLPQNPTSIGTAFDKCSRKRRNTIRRRLIADCNAVVRIFVLYRVWSGVLGEINDAQLYLQTKGLSVHNCAAKIRALESFLLNNRDNLVDDGFKYAKKLCEELDIEPTPQRTRKKKRIYAELMDLQMLACLTNRN